MRVYHLDRKACELKFCEGFNLAQEENTCQ